MTIEVMKQALEALEILNLRGGILADYEDVCIDAITALRQAISQPDCTNCYCFNAEEGTCCWYEPCTNGDKFQALPKVMLYKVTP